MKVREEVRELEERNRELLDILDKLYREDH